MSVTVELAEEASVDADWPTKIAAADPIYSEARFARMVGARILGVRILQRFVDPEHLVEETSTGTRVMSSKVLERPREAGLVFELDDGGLLFFATDLVVTPDDFAVLTDKELNDVPVSAYREVLRLP